jgi:hypothetical protein
MGCWRSNFRGFRGEFLVPCGDNTGQSYAEGDVAKIKTQMPDGTLVDATEVPVEESNERWTDLTLQDGTKMRIKTTVVNVARVDGIYDPQGNPLYIVNGLPTMVIMEVPEKLKQKPPGT